MVKKLLTALLTATVLLMSGLPANTFAEEVFDYNDEQVVYRYAELQTISCNFKADGKASETKLKIVPKAIGQINYIKVEIDVISNTTGRTVKTWNATLYPNSDGNFETVKNYTLTAKGTYHAECIGEAYDKDKNLLDTFSISSKSATY